MIKGEQSSGRGFGISAPLAAACRQRGGGLWCHSLELGGNGLFRVDEIILYQRGGSLNRHSGAATLRAIFQPSCFLPRAQFFVQVFRAD